MSNGTPETITPVATEQRPNIPPHLQRFVPEAWQFVHTYRNLFAAIARDPTVEFEVGMGFRVDLEKRKIQVGIEDWEWAEQNGLGEWAIVWSVCHEIAHLEDLKHNAKAMLDNFVYLRKQARGLRPQAEEALKERHNGELPERLTKQIKIDKKTGETMTVLELFLYQQLHRLYNGLDDRYINPELARGLTIFAPGGAKHDEINRLYRDFLFPTDPRRRGEPPVEEEPAYYLDRPQAVQFGDYLLRRRMVPDQDILVSARVRDVLGGYADDIARARGMTLADEIDEYTTPGRPRHNPRTQDPGWRYEHIRKVVEPVFVELLMEDLRDFEVPPESTFITIQMEGEAEGEAQDGEAQPGDEEQDVSPSAANPWHSFDDKPEPFDIETIRNFIREQEKQAAKKKEQVEHAQLSPEEKAARAQKKRDAKLCERYKVDPKFADEYRELEKSVAPYSDELAAVFEELMQTISLQIRSHWEEGFRSGRFNVDRFIRKYGWPLAMGAVDVIPWEALDTYDQREFVERVTLFPNRIHVRLVLDGSGSMVEDRILAVKQLSILITEALATFEATINARYRLTKPLIVDTEIHIFGSPGENVVAKTFSQGKSWQQERADRFAALGHIRNTYGNTCEAEALWLIASGITEAYAQDLHDNRAKDIVFVTTDGGINSISSFAASGDYPPELEKPESPVDDSRNALGVLKHAGVLARGLQIGTPKPEEIRTFKEIWGKEGQRVVNPKDLVPVVAKLFEEEIRQMQFVVVSYEDEDED